MRIQHRYGLYAVYAILTLVFILGLRAITPDLRTEAAVLLIVLDPTVLGFYFIAAMVLFEKEEGVLDALVVSPLGDTGYLASKVFTLSLLAVGTATSIAVFGHGSPSDLPVLAAGVALSASLFVLIGFVAVARFDSVNEYFISAVGWGTIIFLPMFGYVGLLETQLFYLLPTQPVFLLVEGGFRPLNAWEMGYAIGYLTVANAVAYLWARRSFREHIVRGGTPDHQLGHDTVQQRTDSNGGRWSAFGSPVIGMAVADLRNWTRDPLLAVAAVGPLVLAVLIRFGAPTVEAMTASIVMVEPYYPVIAGSMAVFGPALYGFVVGMFVLEDRELGVLVAYRTSPLSDRGYVLYRGVTAYVLSFGATVPALALIGLVPASPTVLLGTVAIGAFGGPVVTLAFAALASNTIEGLALSKLVNLLVLGPAVVIAAVPEPIQFVAGIVPTFWPVKTYVAGTAGDPAWVAYLFAGIVVHLLAIAILGNAFVKTVE